MMMMKAPAAQDHSCDQPLRGSTVGEEVADNVEGDGSGLGSPEGDPSEPLVTRAAQRYEARSLHLDVGYNLAGLF